MAVLVEVQEMQAVVVAVEVQAAQVKKVLKITKVMAATLK